jgi:hypothetical protein
MKIAILFVGRVRDASTTYENIMKNIVGDNEADVYLSHDPELGEDLEPFRSTYKPVSTNDNPIPRDPFFFTIPETPGQTTVRNKQCQFFNKMRVFEEMISSGRSYDVVILYRTDIFANEPLNLLQIYDDNTVYVPNINDFLGVNDQVAFGSMAAMKVLAYLYLSIQNYCNQGVFFNGEVFVKKHIESTGLTLKRVNFNYSITRPPNWEKSGYAAIYGDRVSYSQTYKNNVETGRLETW